MSSELRGFADWRTRPIERPEPVEKRRCTYVREDGSVCGAVLNSANPGPHCLPHTYGELEIPEWALALAEGDRHQLRSVARMVGDLNGLGRAGDNEWQSAVRRFAASGADHVAVTCDGMSNDTLRQALIRAVRSLKLTHSVRARVRDGIAYLERR